MLRRMIFLYLIVCLVSDNTKEKNNRIFGYKTLNKLKLVNLTIFMFFLENGLIVDKNVIFHFMYFHVSLKRKRYFYC